MTTRTLDLDNLHLRTGAEKSFEEVDATAVLDLFEQEGQNISGLIQIYEQLAGYVSAMQDLLDQH